MELFALAEAGLFGLLRESGHWRAELLRPAINLQCMAVVPLGTEPSKLFCSRDPGATWRELEALRRIPSAPKWSFPPPSWTSHVSAIAPHPQDPALLRAGDELFAGLADGHIYASNDRAASWRLLEIAGPSLRGLKTLEAAS